MVKMISKFHVLIQSKMVWVIFVAIVVISFVLLPVGANLSSRSQRMEGSPGVLDGKPVSPEEYQMARIQTNLSLMLMMLMQGQDLEYNERVREYIDEEAWRRLITLRQADKLGLEAFDSEIATYIRNFPLFEEEDTFSPRLYDSFRNFYLRPRGFTASEFERHVAEEIVLQKIERMLAAGTLVPASHIDRTIEMLVTEYQLQYLVLGEDDLPVELETSADDARAVYDGQPEVFRVPERIHLQYVYFDFDEFLDQARPPSEVELENYYNRNMDDFRYADEQLDGDLEAEGDEEERTSFKPYEEVQAEIETILKRAEARQMAVDAANEMVFELPPDRDGSAPDFGDVAERMGVELRKLEPFRVDELPGVDDSPELVMRAADRLRPNPDEYFSDAVPSESGVYVLGLIERMDSFVPNFEDVREQAFEIAAELNKQEARMETAVRLQERFEALASDGMDLIEAAESVDLKAEETEIFRLQEAGYALPEALRMTNVARQVAFLNQGEFLRPQRLSDGILVAYVSMRVVEEDPSMAMMRGMFLENLMSDNFAMIYREWQESLLREAGFVDRTQRRD